VSWWVSPQRDASLKMRANYNTLFGRSQSLRDTEHRVLTRPRGRGVTQSRDADTVPQLPVDCCLDEDWGQKRKRDRHADLPHAAVFSLRDAMVAVDGVPISSSSQRRPRAIAATRVARVSDRMGRASRVGMEEGSRISRRRVDGVLHQGPGRRWFVHSTMAGRLQHRCLILFDIGQLHAVALGTVNARSTTLTPARLSMFPTCRAPISAWQGALRMHSKLSLFGSRTSTGYRHVAPALFFTLVEIKEFPV
jgi:hypothetical protein